MSVLCVCCKTLFLTILIILLCSPADFSCRKRNVWDGQGLVKGDSTVAETEESDIGQGECCRLVLFIQVGSGDVEFGVLAPFRLAESCEKNAGEEIE